MLRAMASDAVFQPKTIPPTAATKFADSLADYAFRAEYWGIVRTVEREVQDTALAACNGRPFGPEATSLIETAARGFVRQATAGTIRSVMCGLAAHCDSIIELSLGLALGMIVLQFLPSRLMARAKEKSKKTKTKSSKNCSKAEYSFVILSINLLGSQ
jgi:hypothetical protein